MKTVLTYTLNSEEIQDIELPGGAVILGVKNVQDNIVLIALVETEEDMKITRTVAVHGTGHEISRTVKKADKYLGSVMLGGENLAHVFLVK